LNYALSAMAEYDAELTLLHVLEEVPSPAKTEDAIATATQQLDTLIPQEGRKTLKIKTRGAHRKTIHANHSICRGRANRHGGDGGWTGRIGSSGVWFDYLSSDAVGSVPRPRRPRLTHWPMGIATQMIKIITIEREYGSGGGEIAQLVSNHLGWKLWDQLLTEEIARLAECPKSVVQLREERTDPLYYRLFKSFLRGSYEGSLNAYKLKLVDSESILKITERVVQHAAKAGNSVIVGRGSQQFLRNRPDTLRVFLYAPREDKLRRLVARGKSQKDAEQLVDTVDRERTDFLKKYFHVDWPDRGVYHTMINTAIGEQAVAKIILDLAKTLNAGVTAASVAK
jgi:cytidylate kinase